MGCEDLALIPKVAEHKPWASGSTAWLLTDFVGGEPAQGGVGNALRVPNTELGVMEKARVTALDEMKLAYGVEQSVQDSPARK